jgi:UDP-glucose 4-epimerase
MPSFIKDEVGTRAFVEQLDVTDHNRIIEIGQRYKIDGICHMVSPDAELSPAGYYRIVIEGLLGVLEAGRVCEVKRVTIASSQTSYTGEREGPFREDKPMRMAATNQGEAFKKSMEILGSHYSQRTGVEVVAMRIGGIYGPMYHSMGHLVSRVVHNAVNGTPLDRSGESGRSVESRGIFAGDGGDMCYAKDCGKGIALLQTAENLEHRCYNIGSGRFTSNGEMVAAVQKAVPGFQMELKEGTSPAFRPNAYMDLTRISTDTGYQPEYQIERAAQDYADWLRAGNPQ